MRALTLIQPYGGLIATGIKRVENRTWPAPPSMLGQRFAIHAGSKVDRETIEDLLDEGLTEHELWRMRSAVLAVATLDRVVADRITSGLGSFHSLTRDEACWYNGPFGFVLCDIVALPAPVPCKGALGFWTLPSDVERAVREQIGEAA